MSNLNKFICLIISPFNSKWTRILIILLIPFQLIANEGDPIFTLSIEELMNTQVVSTTKSEISASEAPASIYIITKDDIEKYGYSSLEQALAKVPEVFVHFDGHNFSADFRGFFVNNTERRVLYMINGHKINDRFHFGDQYPDIISDLTGVKRIEIIRGPGSALYGNNSILGVVNIITEEPTKKGITKVNIELADINKDSLLHKYTFFHAKDYGKGISVFSKVSWYSGKVKYDTGTDWPNRNGSDGLGDYRSTTDAYFNADKGTSSDSFTTGNPIPNILFNLTIDDFTLGAFLYSKSVSWIWPKDKADFDNPDNDRSWGTGSLYIKYHPDEDSTLGRLGLKASFSFNIHTNRETATWNESNLTYSASQRLQDIYTLGSYYYINSLGNLVDYVDEVFGNPPNTSLLMNSATINGNGGEVKFIYHGIDKTYSFDFQMTPVSIYDEMLQVMIGANFDYSHYENYQRYTYGNNNFIAWSPFGGITDRGYTIGSWIQFIYNPFESLSVITGVRYDYQKIIEVKRQLGGHQLYNSSGQPVRFKNQVAQDVTPRIAIIYRITDQQILKFLYGQAFRAVSAQEMVRLPLNYGEAQSEKTHNIELIYIGRFMDMISTGMNLFYLIGDEIYSWNPETNSFDKGSGWSNLGGTIELRLMFSMGFEFWINSTAYWLRRAMDTNYQSLTGLTAAQIAAKENEYAPLDSPTLLIKWGASYLLMRRTVIAFEMFINNGTETLIPNATATDVVSHRTPWNMTANLILTHSFPFGMRLRFKINNLFDNEYYGVLPYGAEGFGGAGPTDYGRPHQLPAFGRSYSLTASYSF